MTENVEKAKTSDILEMPFLEYARLAAAKDAEAVGKVGPPWMTFDELVDSELTEIEIEAEYGQETAINVGIARDPEDPEWWTDWGSGKPAIEVDPELVEAWQRGELKLPENYPKYARPTAEMVARFRKTGEGWEQRLMEELRIDTESEPQGLEEPVKGQPPK